MTRATRLYGLKDAEVLHLDPQTVFEEVGCDRDENDRTPVLIEEWSVKPPIDHVPSAANIIEMIVERITEDEMTEDGADHWERMTRNDEVVAAAEVLREALASKITYLMADDCLRTLTATWDEAGEPLLDGEPMYIKVTHIAKPESV